MKSLVTLFLILLKPPPPRIIQTQRIIPRLFLPRNLLRLMLVRVLVVPADDFHALVFLAQERAYSAARGAAYGVAEGLCDFFKGRADGAEAFV
jgi:hypothetical protein